MSKVSVIIPVYNVEKYLKKCLDSIIKQTLEDIEIIVVNDGSPDNSQSIIDEYAKKDKRIIPIIQENGRQGKARNTGLKIAKGEYISFVDSDDYLELNMLEKMYNEAKNNDSDIVICGHYVCYEDSNKKEIAIINDNLVQDTINNKHNKLLNIIAPWCKLCKKDLIIDNEITFMEKIYYEDLAFSLKILALANKISFVNEPLYNYIVREGSTMTSSNLVRNLDIITAFDDAIKYFKKHNLYKKYYQELEFLAIDNIYISTIVRIVRSKATNQEKMDIIKKLLNFMNDNFSSYKKNIHIKELSKNRKLIYKLINLKQYWLIRLIFKVKSS